MSTINKWGKKVNEPVWEGDLHEDEVSAPPPPVGLPNRIWAVGFKVWVELREHPTPPVVKRSSISKSTPTKRKTPVYDAGGWHTGYNEEEVMLAQKIVQLQFVGGSVVATLRRDTFIMRTGIGLKEGEVREVPIELAQPIIDNDWTKKVKS